MSSLKKVNPMRSIRYTLAALTAAAAMSVTAAQSAIETAPANAPVKGWTAVAGMSGPAVVKLAHNLPSATEADGDKPWCDSSAAVRSALKSEFNESLVTHRDDGTQLWGSDLTGTWTLTLTRADDTQCVIASGIGYQDGADPATFYSKVGLG